MRKLSTQEVKCVNGAGAPAFVAGAIAGGIIYDVAKAGATAAYEAAARAAGEAMARYYSEFYAQQMTEAYKRAY